MHDGKYKYQSKDQSDQYILAEVCIAHLAQKKAYLPYIISNKVLDSDPLNITYLEIKAKALNLLKKFKDAKELYELHDAVLTKSTGLQIAYFDFLMLTNRYPEAFLHIWRSFKDAYDSASFDYFSNVLNSLVVSDPMLKKQLKALDTDIEAEPVVQIILAFSGIEISNEESEQFLKEVNPFAGQTIDQNEIRSRSTQVSREIVTGKHSHRVLIIATYPPSIGHAGGLRMLDIIKLLKERSSDVYVEVFTSAMKGLCGPLDLVSLLADRVVRADNFNFSLDEYLRKTPNMVEPFDVVDFQFPQPLKVVQSYRKLGRKLLFTPMESIIRRDVIDCKVKPHSDEWAFTDDGILERAIIETVDRTVCVSESDRDVVRQFVQGDIIAIETGVSDIEFGTAYIDSWTPYSVCYVAYFGSNTNRHALKWYLEKVHPLVLSAVPDYTFSIIGRGPVDDILNDGFKNVVHIGEVERIAPHIAKAAVGIAPAFFGSGFRGKINQYAIMGVPCVASPLAAEGLAYVKEESILIAEDAVSFAHAIIGILTNAELREKLSQAAREVALENYSWDSKWESIAKTYGVSAKTSSINLPSVHAVVPSYQHGPYLEERLRSIFAQEYSRIRVTVIDDHSTDDSDGILRKLQDEFNFAYIRRETNSGSPFTSWQYAAENTEEDLIWICESDDAADTMFLAKMVKLIQSKAGTKLAYCGSHIVGKDGQLIGNTSDYLRETFHPGRWQQAFVADGFFELTRYQRFGMTVPNMSSALIDRSAFQAAFTPEIRKYKLAGDWLFVGRLMLEGAVAYSPELLSSFRRHEETARARTDDVHRLAEYLAVRMILSRAAKCDDLEVLEAIRFDLTDLFRKAEQMDSVLKRLAFLDETSAVDLDRLLIKYRPDRNNT